MHASSQRVLIWTGVILLTVFFAAYIFLLGFLPPPSPSLTAAEVAHLYADHNAQFRIGVALMLITGGFYLPWTVVISVQMARHEKGVPIWAIMQGLAGAIGTLLFFLPAVFWAVAAFSADRDPALTLLMHELAFLTFITPVCVFPLQLIPIGIVGLIEKDDATSAFPRWMGYFTFWMVVSAEAGVAAVLFKSGPFAWNGLFPFYLPFSVFGVWITALIYMLLRAIKMQERAG